MMDLEVAPALGHRQYRAADSRPSKRRVSRAAASRVDSRGRVPQGVSNVAAGIRTHAQGAIRPPHGRGQSGIHRLTEVGHLIMEAAREVQFEACHARARRQEPEHNFADVDLDEGRRRRSPGSCSESGPVLLARVAGLCRSKRLRTALLEQVSRARRKRVRR